MYRKFYLWTLVILSTALIFASCSKTGVINNNNGPQTLEGTWAIRSITSDRPYDWNGDGRGETDIYSTYTNCQRDIVIVFQNNGYGQMRQGCNAQWENITYQLYNNNRQLMISLPNDELNLSLSQFDNYTIRGTDPVYIEGNNYAVTYTFQRR